MPNSKQIVFNLVSPLLGEKPEALEELFEIPPNIEQGDLALPCFKFAKEAKKSPLALAKTWQEKLSSQLLPKEISRITSDGGYLNFHLNRTSFANEVLGEIQQKKEKYGFLSSRNQTAVIEFSSPNIAKPLSIGHLRSTNIGASLARIFEARGWKVIRMNHLGDWGTQFGKLISAYRRWGKAEELTEQPIEKLYSLYVRWHQEEESDPSLIEEAREWFAKLEQGDNEAKELWEWFKELTITELKQLYGELSIQFDYYWGESHYSTQVPKVLQELQAKGITKESEGATIVDLKKENLSVAVLQKKDDSSLYLSRDIAAAIYRMEKLNFDRMIYVVGTPQKLHFEQLFFILKKAGYDWIDRCEHVAFGHISFGEEAMSSRKGNIVLLKDVLTRATQDAYKIVTAKNPELKDKHEVARSVALAAVLFADVSSKRIKDVKFSWEEILSFEGETGPYVQYTLVRAVSVLRKWGGKIPTSVKTGTLDSDEEARVIRELSLFPKALQSAEKEREPFYLAKYLLDLSRGFNKFYSIHRVLDAPDEIKSARGWLVSSVAEVLTLGLELLGIPQLQVM